MRRNVAGCVALRRRRGAHRAVGARAGRPDVPAERTILTPAHERCATRRDEPDGCVAVIRGTVRSLSAQDIPENRLAHASRDRMTRVLGRRRRSGGVTSRDSWASGRRSWAMVMRQACCRGSADGLRLTSGSSLRAAVVTRRFALGRTTDDCPPGVRPSNIRPFLPPRRTESSWREVRHRGRSAAMRKSRACLRTVRRTHLRQDGATDHRREDRATDHQARRTLETDSPTGR